MKNSIKSLPFAILLSLIVGLVVYQVTKTSVLQTEVKAEAELVNQEPQQEEAKAAEDVKSDSTVKEISGADNKGTKVLATIKKSKAKSVSAHKKQQKKIEIARRGKPTYQPLPLIPSELRYEALKTQAKARFFIAANGEVTKVEFVKAANEPKLNHLLEKSLRKWKFESGTISFVQDINVTFRVE